MADQGCSESSSAEDHFDQPTGRGDAISGLLSLIFAAAGAILIVPMWVYVPERVAGTIDSPAVMPLLMLSLLALFGTILLVGTLRKGDFRESHRIRQDWVRAGGMMAVCAGYLLLIFVIGLPIATGLALAAAMLYFGEGRWTLVLSVSIITPLLLWAFFAYVVQVPMPQPLLRLGTLQLEDSVKPPAGPHVISEVSA